MIMASVFIRFWFGLILWHINHVWLFMSNPVFAYKLKYVWFVNRFCRYTQLKDQTVLFQIIQFIIRHLFAPSLNFKQFYSTNGKDPIRSYRSRPEWIWERRQWRGILHSPKLLHCWSFAIRFFGVISQTLVVGGGEGFLSLCRDVVGEFYRPIRLD